MKRILSAVLLTQATSVFALTPSEIDVVKDFSELNEVKTNISALSSDKLMNFSLGEYDKPWSGPFWPSELGGISSRFSNNKVKRNLKSIRKDKKVLRNVLKDITKVKSKIYSMSEQELAKLSPAEKYDVIVGDMGFNFAQSNINLEIFRMQKNKSVSLSAWNGICHGWAPASIALPRPRMAVMVPVLDGTKTLKVYPSDMKALGSYMFASMSYQNKKKNNITESMYGKRCNVKAKDIRYSRKTGTILSKTSMYIDQNGATVSSEEKAKHKDFAPCNDLNPAVFHLTMLHSVAMNNKSFVIDIDHDAKVNNHAISGYRVEYFHPESLKHGHLGETLTMIDSLSKDELAHKRSPEAVKTVNVKMTVQLTHWMRPERKHTDSASKDKNLDRSFFYQLDVDARGNIVGGNWIPSATGKIEFPDFMWGFKKNIRMSEEYRFPVKDIPLEDLSATPGVTLAAKKNSSFMEIYWNSFRMFHGAARGKGLKSVQDLIFSKRDELQQTIPELANDKDGALIRAANMYEDELDQLGIPSTQPNPQVLSDVIYKLFDMAK